MWMLSTVYINLVILYVLHFSSAENRLIFTHVIYRHGDRSPSHTFPNDKYQEDAWPVKWGQLTPKGVKEQYELGAYLRKRYDGFISRNFSREEVYVRSSDRDRALESAQSNLAGFYQPTVETECNQWLDWQPIPIHSTAKEEDYLLQTDADDNCPTYQRIDKETSTKFIDDMNEKYKEFFIFLMNQTGLQELDFLSIGDVYGPVSREKLYGWELPAWVNQVWNGTSGETVYNIVARLRRTVRFMQYDTPGKARLMSGYLVGDIVDRMKKKASGKLKKPSKMVMYSAHEGTLLGLLFGMNISNGRPVPYAACMIIELHQSVSDPKKYFVSIHYRNDTAHDPYPLITPGCLPVISNEVYCPLDVFEDSVKANILYPLEKLHQACGRHTCGSGTSRTAGIMNWTVMTVACYGLTKTWLSLYT